MPNNHNDRDKTDQDSGLEVEELAAKEDTAVGVKAKLNQIEDAEDTKKDHSNDRLRAIGATSRERDGNERHVDHQIDGDAEETPLEVRLVDGEERGQPTKDD